MRRALLRLGVVVWTVGAAAVGVAPTVARADAPEQQGWWTEANPGGLPANPSDAAVDVPKDGLLVQAGPDSPTAYAGLIYELGNDETASSLTLKVAPNSATTPVASLELCPLKGTSLDIEQGGPMTDAPAYDCKEHQTAALDAGGSTFKFTVDTLQTGSTLAIAILPGDPNSRVVLSKPDESSLSTTPSLDPNDDSFTTGAPTADDTSNTSTGQSTTSGNTSGPAPQPAPNVGAPPPSTGTTGASAPSQRTPQVAPDPADSAAATNLATAPVAATSDAGSSSGLAVVLLIAGLGVGAVLWSMAGRGPLDGLPET